MTESASRQKQSTNTPRTDKTQNIDERRRAAFHALDRFVQQKITSSGDRVIRLRPQNTIPFSYRGKPQYVTTSDINAYTDHLMSQRIAERITREKGMVYCFHIPPEVVARIKKAARSPSMPKQTFSNEVRTRQKPVGVDPGPIPSWKAAAPNTKPSTASSSNGNTLPSAADLCLPILQSSSSPIKFGKLMKAVAKRLGLGDQKSNRAFVTRMQVAADYLQKKELLERKEKLYVRSAVAEDKALWRQEWTDLVEPELKQRPINPGPRSVFQGHKADIQKIIATFATAAAQKLSATYANAQRMLEEPDDGHSHAKAQSVLEALDVEFRKRVSAGHDRDEWFRWPETVVSHGNGTMEKVKMHPDGMLAHLGYHVGRTKGEPSTYRQFTLRRIFERALPAAFDKAHMDEWGPEGSSHRLRKMAECIANFTKNAKRKRSDSYDDAILEWEQDLQYLHDNYYVGKFSFGWPSTAIATR